MKKRLLSLLLCAVLLFGTVLGCSVGVSAAEYNFSLTVSQITAVPGDTVVFNVDIADNPGIMAMTITFHYDSSVLEFDRFYSGLYAKDTLVDHGDYISIVNCYSKNIYGDGVFFGLQFRVKDNAPAGFHEVTIRNIRPAQYGDSLTGCFANWKGDRLIPQLTPGGITVGYTGDNCDHRFTDWETTVPPTCTEVGAKTHSCTVCGHSEMEELPAAGHSYDENWTIDRAAEESRDGVMTRHCTRCDATTDKVFFTVKDAAANGFSNTVGTVIAPGSWQHLQEITEQNGQQPPQASESPAADEPVNPDPPSQVTIPAEEDGDPAENAVDLVNAARSDNIGLFGKVYRYLFGIDGEGGIVPVIRGAVSDSARQVFGWIRLTVAGLLYLWLL